MNTGIWSRRTIRDIVTSHPVAANLFREHGIDFCCQGDLILAEAMNGLGHSEKEIYLALEDIQKKGKDTDPERLSVTGMSPPELLDYILATYHPWFWKNLPSIRALLSESLRAHGQKHSELYDIYKLFGELSMHLEPHLIREETEFAPLINAGNDTQLAQRRLLIQIFTNDHSRSTGIMRQIRHASKGYSLPAEVSEIYKNLYVHLEQLEDHLYQYIHLENNILFPSLAESAAS